MSNSSGNYSSGSSYVEEHSATQERNTYLRDRLSRLYRIQAHKLKNDGNLLRSIPDQNRMRWFDYVGVLPEISKHLRDRNNSERKANDKKVDNLQWFKSTHYNHELDEPDYDLKNLNFMSEKEAAKHYPLRLLRDWTWNNPFSPPDKSGGNDEVWRYLGDAFDMMHHLQLLLRFVDERNPKVDSYPDVNGENLQDPDPKLAWVLHRAWIRTIHLRSLMMGLDPVWSEHLEEILMLNMALHNRETVNGIITVLQQIYHAEDYILD